MLVLKGVCIDNIIIKLLKVSVNSITLRLVQAHKEYSMTLFSLIFLNYNRYNLIFWEVQQ